MPTTPASNLWNSSPSKNPAAPNLLARTRVQNSDAFPNATRLMPKFRSMRMKQIAFLLAACCFGSSLAAQEKPARPKITGIDHIRIYVTNIEKSRAFYSKLIGVRPGGMCFYTSLPCFTVGWTQDQTILLEKVPTPDAKNWLAEISFATDDVERMRSYLV